RRRAFVVTALRLRLLRGLDRIEAVIDRLGPRRERDYLAGLTHVPRLRCRHAAAFHTSHMLVKPSRSDCLGRNLEALPLLHSHILQQVRLLRDMWRDEEEQLGFALAHLRTA